MRSSLFVFGKEDCLVTDLVRHAPSFPHKPVGRRRGSIKTVYKLLNLDRPANATANDMWVIGKCPPARRNASLAHSKPLDRIASADCSVSRRSGPVTLLRTSTCTSPA